MTTNPTTIPIRATPPTTASQLADQVTQLTEEMARVTEERDTALDERDDARETACRFEAEIALTKPVVDAAVALTLKFSSFSLGSGLLDALFSRVDEFAAAIAEAEAS